MTSHKAHCSQTLPAGSSPGPWELRWLSKRFPSPHLHLLDEPRQRLQPGHHVRILLRVHDLDLLPELGDDGARPPAVLQRQVLHREKGGKARRLNSLGAKWCMTWFSTKLPHGCEFLLLFSLLLLYRGIALIFMRHCWFMLRVHTLPLSLSFTKAKPFLETDCIFDSPSNAGAAGLLHTWSYNLMALADSVPLAKFNHRK